MIRPPAAECCLFRSRSAAEHRARHDLAPAASGDAARGTTCTWRCSKPTARSLINFRMASYCIRSERDGRCRMLRLYRLLQEVRPDVIFSNGFPVNLLTTALKPFLVAEPRLVLREVNVLDALLKGGLKQVVLRQAARHTFRRADAIICQSQFMERDLQSGLRLGRDPASGGGRRSGAPHRVGAPQQDHVGFLDLHVPDRSAARSEHCRQTDDGGSVSSSIAGVDVVRPHHHAGELLRQVVHLVRGLRAGEHAEGVRLRAIRDRCPGNAEPCGRPIERFVPRCRSQRRALRVAHHRRGQRGSLGAATPAGGSGRSDRFPMRAASRASSANHTDHRPTIRTRSTMRNPVAVIDPG